MVILIFSSLLSHDLNSKIRRRHISLQSVKKWLIQICINLFFLSKDHIEVKLILWTFTPVENISEICRLHLTFRKCPLRKAEKEGHDEVRLRYAIARCTLIFSQHFRQHEVQSEWNDAMNDFTAAPNRQTYQTIWRLLISKSFSSNDQANDNKMAILSHIRSISVGKERAEFDRHSRAYHCGCAAFFCCNRTVLKLWWSKSKGKKTVHIRFVKLGLVVTFRTRTFAFPPWILPPGLLVYSSANLGQRREMSSIQTSSRNSSVQCVGFLIYQL